MKLQKNSEYNRGVLYIVGTPIGNLDDMTERARKTLAEVDCIAAEDTRHTRKLLTHFSFSTPLISYHEHSRVERELEILERLHRGESVAIVSDAGMPAISDPGAELVKRAIAEGIAVVPIPGANAALAALVGSGLSPQPFLFLGFLPRKSQERKRELQKWRQVEATLVMYESPHRVKAMLQDTKSTLGDRQIVLARELTKKHEEWLRGSVSESLTWLQEHEARGEYTIVVEGLREEARGEEERDKKWWRQLTVEEHVNWFIRRGRNSKEAIKAVAKERDLSKREVYQVYHVEEEE
ncbi:16S rRNA (cytidine(1402)-2'-O)-methyltransferase [Mechercharimyces sp. CAU 1602]|uniref:16S rRNA (cytidine(1402)-2'-O)-methyltransferase n=1 Tax=Mechercharimyces sp. CAU 1602 TaxID=2973933 RepID=UPI0021634F93|nr:16S rRNA (cytidine(1402)-2'-O)-methyltransferase [Mechercharimyces sp. CAU 1602]MCS1352361.1 16S rRNA (cytidine(1402)-2'-O)-methyltransferase [Mechercharimyces sp. CAU 1602]